MQDPARMFLRLFLSNLESDELHDWPPGHGLKRPSPERLRQNVAEDGLCTALRNDMLDRSGHECHVIFATGSDRGNHQSPTAAAKTGREVTCSLDSPARETRYARVRFVIGMKGSWRACGVHMS